MRALLGAASAVQTRPCRRYRRQRARSPWPWRQNFCRNRRPPCRRLLPRRDPRRKNPGQLRKFHAFRLAAARIRCRRTRAHRRRAQNVCRDAARASPRGAARRSRAFRAPQHQSPQNRKPADSRPALGLQLHHRNRSRQTRTPRRRPGRSAQIHQRPPRPRPLRRSKNRSGACNRAQIKKADAKLSRRPKTKDFRIVTSLHLCFVTSPFPSAVAASPFTHHPRSSISAVARHVIADAPQPPAQALRQLVPRAPQPRLQRIFRHAELLRRFARRVTLDFAQHKRRAQQRRQLIQVLADHLANFRPRKNLLRIRTLRRESFHHRQFVFARWFVERHRGPRLRASPPHQRRVDHDARQPRRKLRTTFESLQISIRRQQSILQRIFRVLCVSQNAQGRLKQRPVIALKQRAHRLLIALLSSANQLVFVVLRPACRHCASNISNNCRLCRHQVPHLRSTVVTLLTL